MLPYPRTDRSPQDSRGHLKIHQLNEQERSRERKESTGDGRSRKKKDPSRRLTRKNPMSIINISFFFSFSVTSVMRLRY
ncbi:hypothetical protein P167DRAFT_122123 [Morchella conica CCBAS932]|uniref:Uncharacterized protein n=1 Tax=Morchella conica CCBAS932 TaxID=1392247 RepID=A0A3N4L6W8_9PEZI|nr:hypothetical protein P167DRAFT_122123 [Morchella conica CCBAS932]